MQAVLNIRTMPQPVIAAVNGPAAGAGMNLALACDIRLAVDAPFFGQNFAKVGLFPDYGGTYFLPQLVRPIRRSRNVLLGEMIDAQSAHRLGIINHLFQRTNSKPPSPLSPKNRRRPAACHSRCETIHLRTRKDVLMEALEREVEAQLKCFHSHDCLEGIRAFMEKRQPKFQGS